MKIGQVIRTLRLEKRTTLEDIAFVAGMDAANLSRIERGLQNATPEILESIAKALDFSISSLYLMAEQAATPYEIAGTKEQAKQIAKRLEEFVTKFMLLTPENQHLVNEFIKAMLKAQAK